MVDAQDKKVIHDCKKLLAEILVTGARAALHCTDKNTKAGIEKTLVEIKEVYDTL